MTKEEKKEYDKKYSQTHKEQKRKDNKQYYQANKEQLREYVKNYAQTSKGKKVNKKAAKKYAQSLKGKKVYKKSHKKYAQTPKGREFYRKATAKRQRTLGFIPLNKFFEGSEAHHIDRNRVIYIPKELHRSIWHSLSLNINMDKINKLAFEYLKIKDESHIIMKKTNYHYNQNSRRRPSLQDRLNRAIEITNLYNSQEKTKRLTLEDIGKLKGLTRERVRQILLWYKKYKKVETK